MANEAEKAFSNLKILFEAGKELEKLGTALRIVANADAEVQHQINQRREHEDRIGKLRAEQEEIKKQTENAKVEHQKSLDQLKEEKEREARQLDQPVAAKRAELSRLEDAVAKVKQENALAAGEKKATLNALDNQIAQRRKVFDDLNADIKALQERFKA